MKNKFSFFTLLFIILIFTICVGFKFSINVKINSLRQTSRQAEYLTRGGYAINTEKGNYISWKLLGDEPLNQKYDIYKNGNLYISSLDSTNYIDKKGTEKDKYNVVITGKKPLNSENIDVRNKNYIEIKLDKPKNGKTPNGKEYSYFISELSVGDADADGIYEYFVLWMPTNQRDNSKDGYTGNVYLDCYKLSGQKLWRIDFGTNISAGPHYIPFIVYDFDNNGIAEVAFRTTVGSKDSTGEYVSNAGFSNRKSLIWSELYTKIEYTNNSDLRDHKTYEGRIYHGPDWITIFDGQTGRAINTANFYPQRGRATNWGLSYDYNGNRSERFLAGVAYLDGKHPSLIFSRGYYKRAAMAAYNWNGKELKLLWARDDKFRDKNLFGNGNHQLAVADADNDGKDEIVFGSTVVDNDGSILNSTNHGHGDALLVSDFNNDGEQEIFQIHEKYPHYLRYGAELRKAKDAQIVAAIPSTKDVARGIIGNFYDYKLPSLIFTSVNNNGLFDYKGSHIGNIPEINPAFAIWWDGDLERELVYKTQIFKLKKSFSNKFQIKEIENFQGVKALERDVPLFQADLFGDWREEICYPTKDNNAIRIYFTTYPTKYKMPTLMHDTQYRTAVAMQNVGYNQPPYPKFYIGKKAVSRNRHYLSPVIGYDKIYVMRNIYKK